MTSILRPVPIEPRPTITGIPTVRMAVRKNAEALIAWARKHGYGGENSDDELLDDIADAVKQAEGDPARGARLLEMVYHWKVDTAILWHLQVVKKNLALCGRQLMLRWVLRSGIRFPGNVGDLVCFMDGLTMRNGRVVEVQKNVASAIVQTENGNKGFVHAEHVVTNKTTGKDSPAYLLPAFIGTSA